MEIKEKYQNDIKNIINENIEKPIGEIKSILKVVNGEIIEKISKSGEFKNNDIVELIVNGAIWKNEVTLQITSIKNQLKQKEKEQKEFQKYILKQQLEREKRITEEKRIAEEKRQQRNIYFMILCYTILSMLMFTLVILK